MSRNRLAMARSLTLTLVAACLASGNARAGGIVIKNTTVTPVNDPQYFFQFDVEFKAGTILRAGTTLSKDDYVEIDKILGIIGPNKNGSTVTSELTLEPVPPSTSIPFTGQDFTYSIAADGKDKHGVRYGDLVWYYTGTSDYTFTQDVQVYFTIGTLPRYDHKKIGGEVTSTLSYTTAWHEVGSSEQFAAQGQTTPVLQTQIAAAVPEPATLALGVLGLGLVGIRQAMRRRFSGPGARGAIR